MCVTFNFFQSRCYNFELCAVCSCCCRCRRHWVSVPVWSVCVDDVHNFRTNLMPSTHSHFCRSCRCVRACWLCRPVCLWYMFCLLRFPPSIRIHLLSFAVNNNSHSLAIERIFYHKHKTNQDFSNHLSKVWTFVLAILSIVNYFEGERFARDWVLAKYQRFESINVHVVVNGDRYSAVGCSHIHREKWKFKTECIESPSPIKATTTNLPGAIGRRIRWFNELRFGSHIVLR